MKFKINWKALENHKKEDPYTRLHKVAAKKAGGIPDGAHINVSAVKVTEKDNSKLESIAKAWIVSKGYSEYGANRSVAWLSLDIGPGIIDDVAPGNVYVDVPNLFKKRGV